MHPTDPTKLSRRRFLGVVVAPSVGALLGVTACADEDPGSSNDAGFDIDVNLDGGFDIGGDIGGDDAGVDVREYSNQELVAAFFDGADMAGIRAIGRSWLRRFDGNDAIVADLAVILRPLAAIAALDDAVAQCETWIDDEFAEVDVISLEGWVMSPTEVRLCALAEAVA